MLSMLHLVFDEWFNTINHQFLSSQKFYALKIRIFGFLKVHWGRRQSTGSSHHR
jgi:predicted DNA-binding WGR domain protein